MKKLSPKDLLSNFVDEITERMSEQEQNYKERIAQLESDNMEYHSRNKELSKNLNELKIKSSSTLECLKTKEKQLKKYKNLLNLTPGTEATKVELLEYFTNDIIPYISEKIESKHTEKIKEYLEKEILNKEEYNEKKSLEINSQKYYVYSHTIEGEQFPFYIGFSRNNDGDYKRSKDFSTRSYPWFEYIFSKGGFNNVKINTKILVEIETEKEALELETYFIKYYSESVVNTLKK